MGLRVPETNTASDDRLCRRWRLSGRPVDVDWAARGSWRPSPAARGSVAPNPAAPGRRGERRAASAGRSHQLSASLQVSSLAAAHSAMCAPIDRRMNARGLAHQLRPIRHLQPPQTRTAQPVADGSTSYANLVQFACVSPIQSGPSGRAATARAATRVLRSASAGACPSGHAPATTTSLVPDRFRPRIEVSLSRSVPLRTCACHDDFFMCYTASVRTLKAFAV